MEQLIIEFLRGFDIQTIITVTALGWYFSNQIKKEFSKEIKEVREDIKEVREDIKDIRTKLLDLDRRLCRIEGILSARDCCMLNDESKIKKAE